jgi:acetyl-CoA carboxylase beta subunit
MTKTPKRKRRRKRATSQRKSTWTKCPTCLDWHHRDRVHRCHRT